MDIEKLMDDKISYVSWSKERLQVEKLLLYERLALIETILKEKGENKNGQIKN